MKNLFVKIMMVLTAISMTISTVHAKKAAKSPNLIETAVAVNSEGVYAGQFDTLLLLASMDAEVASVLSNKGQHTLFAPTDAAFDNLFTVANENCITLDAKTVNAALKYHVVQGRRDSDDILASDRIRTLLGAFFEQSGGIITDNADQQANIIVTDVAASNGVIHAIDIVLLPFPVTNNCAE